MSDEQNVTSLVMHAIGSLAVEQRPRPELRSGEVRIAVHAVNYCRTDVLGYLGANDRRQRTIDGSGPLVMGHEMVGHVAELGPDVTEPAVGTPVVVDPIVSCGTCGSCRGGAGNACLDRRVVGVDPEWPGAYAESLVVPAGNAVPFVGEVPLSWGAFVEPLAVGAHGLNRAGEVAGRRVLVLGGGIVGTGAALQAQRRGAASVAVSEPLAERRALLAGLGLTTVAPDEVGGGYEIAVDCVATSDTLTQAVGALRRQGRLVVVGVAAATADVPIMRVVDEELAVLGSFGSTRDEIATVTRWVASGELDLDGLVQARVGWDDVIAGFDRYREPSPPFRTALWPNPDPGG
jgi:threonine dehydrogenase-like Zn-dependent dehydrogenase